MSRPLDQALIDIERALGSGRVIDDADVLQSYAIDESEAAPVCPDAAVRVCAAGDAAVVMAAAHKHGIPVTPRAAGTGRTGGAVPVAGGIVLAFERFNALKGIEHGDLTCTLEPGLITGELHAQVEAEGLFYPPDPNSLSSCTLGGNAAENAGGPRTLRYGPTRDYVLGMEMVSADGTPLSLGKRTVKGVTGYDLCSLVVGSEGTLGIITELTLKLLPKPQSVVTMAVLLPNMESAGQAVGNTLAAGILPRCLELLDGLTLDVVRPDVNLPIPEAARAMLLVELDGDEVAMDSALERCGSAMDEAGALEILVARHGGERERLWQARRELSRSLRKQANNKLAEDVVVPRSRIPALIDACARISETHAIAMPSYGHAGDGNIHVNFLWDNDEQRPAVDRAIEALFREVIALGGTLTGEHGIGLLKAPYLGLEQSPELIRLQEQVKQLFDPRGILNPGKIFPGALKRSHGPC